MPRPPIVTATAVSPTLIVVTVTAVTAGTATVTAWHPDGTTAAGAVVNVTAVLGA
jgi:uncharacterized protein YjdB